MPALLESVVGVSSMQQHSQIANVSASPIIRKSRNYIECRLSQTADMDESDKNGGPNHLRAWMRYRKMSGVGLADALGDNVTPGMVSDLVNSNRALSAKWLRRLAEVLDTSPGMLLDHDPNELATDIVEIWGTASTKQRAQLINMARVIVPNEQATGTDGK